MFDFYCESEQGSSCSTPFVSAPSSPSRSNQIKTARLKNNSLYYYFSAPSSPPRHRREEEDQQQEQQRGFSFAECEFEFQSRIFAESSAQQEQHHQSSSAAAAALKNHQEEEEDQMMEDAHEMSGFYFSAPTSPDRNKDLRLKKSAAAATCSYWDEMPGTPKMIFGSGAGSQGFFNADSDFEFSSSRMSDSDSTISAQMSSADELFFKGQLLPMKLSSQLTSSDSSGSSNTMTSSSTVTGSAPQSPRSGKKGGILLGASPNRVKSAVMGTICGAVMKPEEESSSGSAAGARVRSLSPFHLLKKYQSLMMTMGRPSSTCSSSTKSSGAAASSQIPRPSRSSSRGRTLRELLHLSSVHKKSKASSTPSPDQILQASSASDLKSEEIPKAATSDSTAADTAEDRSRVSKKLNAGSSSAESRKRYVERSLVGDYNKRFNTKQQQSKPASPAASAALATGIPRRRFHSGSVLDLHYSYYNSKRMLHSGSIVPEADFPIEKRLNYHAVAEIPHRRQMNHVYPRGDCNRFANAAALASSLDQKAGNHSRRWESGVYYSDSSRSMNGISSTSSSRNLSPRRARQQQQQGISSGSCSSAQAGVSLHELHYKNQRANAEELRRKTFLPYKQGLLGCLGCATMRIAGLSKSLQPMAASRG